MNTNQTTASRSRTGLQPATTKKAFFRTIAEFMLPFISQLFELMFPGLMNGIVLTPELLSVFIRSFIHSA